MKINTSRDDIYCPGDTISYNCSITSNSEMPHLTWKVTFPGLEPINFTYNRSSSILWIDHLDMNISITLLNFTTTSLTEYVNEEFIESMLIFTVLENVTMNGTIVECGIANLHNDTATLFANTSGK